MFRYLIVILSVLIAAPIGAAAANHQASGGGLDSLVRLPGHVLLALAQAKRSDLGESVDKSNEPLTLTLVLKRDDQAGFDRYLQEVYDPKSKIYRHFLNQGEIAAKFGPSRDAYDSVLRYLKKNGFELVEGSANRLTLTVRGTRTETDHAFDIHISDYKIGDKRFHANDNDPALPKQIASRVEGVTGLLCPAGDPEMFSHALHSLLCNPSARQRMGQAGRERVLANYTVDRMAQNYQRLYESLTRRGDPCAVSLAS